MSAEDDKCLSFKTKQDPQEHDEGTINNDKGTSSTGIVEHKPQSSNIDTSRNVPSESSKQANDNEKGNVTEYDVVHQEKQGSDDSLDNSREKEEVTGSEEPSELENISEQYPTKPKVVLQRTPSSPAVETRVLSKGNCTEKIILCIDHSAAMFSSQFKRTVQSIKQSSVFHIIAGAIQQFILTKSYIDKRHEFSLVMLNEDAQLITEFSNQGSEVLFVLHDIANDAQSSTDESSVTSNNFNLSNLFDLIEGQVKMPDVPKSPMMPPPYTTRVIFVFGRSHGKLDFQESKQSFLKLSKNPYFFVDCVYIHEEPDESNDVTDIFSCMCELDRNGSSYILEVGLDGSMSGLYNAFVKLLAHPLQRKRQIGDFCFNLTAVSEPGIIG